MLLHDFTCRKAIPVLFKITQLSVSYLVVLWLPESDFVFVYSDS